MYTLFAYYVLTIDNRLKEDLCGLDNERGKLDKNKRAEPPTKISVVVV